MLSPSIAWGVCSGLWRPVEALRGAGWCDWLSGSVAALYGACTALCVVVRGEGVVRAIVGILSIGWGGAGIVGILSIVWAVC